MINVIIYLMNIDFGINLADELKIVTTKIHSTNFARQNLKEPNFRFTCLIK